VNLFESAYLFAVQRVTDYEAARDWYSQLLGSPPSFLPNEVEAVWDLAEHRSVVIEAMPEHAGHGTVTLFVADLDAVLADIAERGLQPAEQENYDNGVRKAIFRDPDGNEVGFGGASG
jgi:catechol 2,3-dioxygenase-like lactoylglutathione lyase family enzyme